MAYTTTGISLIDIRAEIFKFDDVDNLKLATEMDANTDRYSSNPASVQYEDTIISEKGPEFNKLFTQITKIGYERNLKLVHYHLLKHEPLESTNTHHHINKKIDTVASFVYYVSVLEGAGNLVFMLDQYDLYPQYVHKPEEGTLVMFPSYMLHKVTKNMSQGKRISISGDFVLAS
jgi:hypothetical protein